MARTFNLFILTLLTGLCLGLVRPLPAAAWELIRGRVLSITAAAAGVKLTLAPDNTAGGDDRGETIELEIEPDKLPPDLKAGDSIRVWAKTVGGSRLLQVSSSRGYDATGVRSRLSGRGRGVRGGGSGRGGGGK